MTLDELRAWAAKAPSKAAKDRDAPVRPVSPGGAELPSGLHWGELELADYVRQGGFGGLSAALSWGPAALVETLGAAGLRSRNEPYGLLAESLGALAKAAGRRFVVANAAGPEPAVSVGLRLIRGNPFAVIEGLCAAGFAGGAERGWIYADPLGAEDRSRLEAAIGAVRAAGILGEGVLGSEFSFDVVLKEASRPDSSPGEDTAALADIEERTPMPSIRPTFPSPYPFLGGRAAVVDAEAAAHAAFVIERGAAVYESIGLPDFTGTKLFVVTGAAEECLAELPTDAALDGLLELAAPSRGVGNGSGRPRAALIGGSRGGWAPLDDGGDASGGDAPRVGDAPGVGAAPARDWPSLRLDPASLGEAYCSWGTGEVRLLRRGECVVAETASRAESSRAASCGKCSICREGTFQLREILKDMTAGKSLATDRELAIELGEAMRLSALCAHGRGSPSPILSGLSRFFGEFDAHMSKRRCDALACSAYVSFVIRPEACAGCGDCAVACPEDAIAGKARMIHVIDQSDCVRCGACAEACPEGAIGRYGAVKPATPKAPVPVGSWRKRSGGSADGD